MVNLTERYLVDESVSQFRIWTQSLSAPQSGAHRRGAFGDPIPSKPSHPLKRSKAFFSDLWQSVTLVDH